MLCAGVAAAALYSLPAAAQTTRHVAPGGADLGTCESSACASLAYTLGQSADGDLVLVGAGTYTEANISVQQDVTIRGAGRDATIVQAAPEPGVGPGRVFSVVSGASVVIEDLTIRHGYATQPEEGGALRNLGRALLRRVDILHNAARAGSIAPARGGGLYNRGHMVLDHVTVAGNWAERPESYGSSVGGGIYHHGVTGDEHLEITNSTIDDNTADVSGGVEVIDDQCYCAGPTVAISNTTISHNRALRAGGLRNSLGDVTLRNSTVSGNVATALWGGGIDSEGGTLTVSHSTISANDAVTRGGGISSSSFSIRGSIISGNSAASGADCHTGGGVAESLDYNLVGEPAGCALTGAVAQTVIGVAAALGPLSNNTGPTLTHALLEGSPAIGNGTCESVDGSPVELDQRGLERGSVCDIGAFEFDAGVATNAPVSPTGSSRLLLASANPFHDRVVVTLLAAETQPVTLALYDAMGRRIVILFAGEIAAGSVRQFEVDGAGLAPGVYVLVAQGRGFTSLLSLTRAR